MNLALVRGMLSCLLFTLATAAQADPARYLEGVHYQRLDNASASRDSGAADGQQSILEVFWYGCGHCYAFDPPLNAWVAGKGDSISFARTPMIWDDATKEHARLFHTTHALGLHEEMHDRIFAEIHQKRNFLLDRASMAALFSDFGISEEEFTKGFTSFGVDAEVRKAESLQRELSIRSVPALIVNGRYLVNSTEDVPTHQAMLDVTSYLLSEQP